VKLKTSFRDFFVVVLTVALVIAAFEGTDRATILDLRPWQTHLLTITFCIVSIVSLRALLAHVREIADILRMPLVAK